MTPPPRTEPGEGEPLDRIQAQLDHAKAHHMLAVSLDVGDVEALLVAVQRPALSFTVEYDPPILGLECDECGKFWTLPTRSVEMGEECDDCRIGHYRLVGAVPAEEPR